ncbi:unnamed protein product [Amoebophrya sp. A25]|nr:unnamed protein product [Amoebophrya sp. A25]|eukprot:GSA25T00009037001.1
MLVLRQFLCLFSINNWLWRWPSLSNVGYRNDEEQNRRITGFAGFGVLAGPGCNSDPHASLVTSRCPNGVYQGGTVADGSTSASLRLNRCKAAPTVSMTSDGSPGTGYPAGPQLVFFRWYEPLAFPYDLMYDRREAYHLGCCFEDEFNVLQDFCGGYRENYLLSGIAPSCERVERYKVNGIYAVYTVPRANVRYSCSNQYDVADLWDVGNGLLDFRKNTGATLAQQLLPYVYDYGNWDSFDPYQGVPLGLSSPCDMSTALVQAPTTGDNAAASTPVSFYAFRGLNILYVPEQCRVLPSPLGVVGHPNEMRQRKTEFTCQGDLAWADGDGQSVQYAATLTSGENVTYRLVTRSEVQLPQTPTPIGSETLMSVKPRDVRLVCGLDGKAKLTTGAKPRELSVYVEMTTQQNSTKLEQAVAENPAAADLDDFLEAGSTGCTLTEYGLYQERGKYSDTVKDACPGTTTLASGSMCTVAPLMTAPNYSKPLESQAVFFTMGQNYRFDVSRHTLDVFRDSGRSFVVPIADTSQLRYRCEKTESGMTHYLRPLLPAADSASLYPVFVNEMCDMRPLWNEFRGLLNLKECEHMPRPKGRSLFFLCEWVSPVAAADKLQWLGTRDSSFSLKDVDGATVGVGDVRVMCDRQTGIAFLTARPAYTYRERVYSNPRVVRTCHSSLDFAVYGPASKCAEALIYPVPGGSTGERCTTAPTFAAEDSSMLYFFGGITSAALSARASALVAIALHTDRTAIRYECTADGPTPYIGSAGTSPLLVAPTCSMGTELQSVFDAGWLVISTVCKTLPHPAVAIATGSMYACSEDGALSNTAKSQGYRLVKSSTFGTASEVTIDSAAAVTLACDATGSLVLVESSTGTQLRIASAATTTTTSTTTTASTTVAAPATTFLPPNTPSPTNLSACEPPSPYASQNATVVVSMKIELSVSSNSTCDLGTDANALIEDANCAAEKAGVEATMASILELAAEMVKIVASARLENNLLPASRKLLATAPPSGVSGSTTPLGISYEIVSKAREVPLVLAKAANSAEFLARSASYMPAGREVVAVDLETKIPATTLLSANMEVVPSVTTTTTAVSGGSAPGISDATGSESADMYSDPMFIVIVGALIGLALIASGLAVLLYRAPRSLPSAGPPREVSNVTRSSLDHGGRLDTSRFDSSRFDSCLSDAGERRFSVGSLKTDRSVSMWSNRSSVGLSAPPMGEDSPVTRDAGVRIRNTSLLKSEPYSPMGLDEDDSKPVYNPRTARIMGSVDADQGLGDPSRAEDNYPPAGQGPTRQPWQGPTTRQTRGLYTVPSAFDEQAEDKWNDPEPTSSPVLAQEQEDSGHDNRKQEPDEEEEDIANYIAKRKQVKSKSVRSKIKMMSVTPNRVVEQEGVEDVEAVETRPNYSKKSSRRSHRSSRSTPVKAATARTLPDAAAAGGKKSMIMGEDLHETTTTRANIIDEQTIDVLLVREDEDNRPSITSITLIPEQDGAQRIANAPGEIDTDAAAGAADASPSTTPSRRPTSDIIKSIKKAEKEKRKAGRERRNAGEVEKARKGKKKDGDDASTPEPSKSTTTASVTKNNMSPSGIEESSVLVEVEAVPPPDDADAPTLPSKSAAETAPTLPSKSAAETASQVKKKK